MLGRYGPERATRFGVHSKAGDDVVSQLARVGLEPADVPKRIAQLTGWMGDEGRVTRSLDWFVEVVNPQVSKSRALAMVADRLGIARAEVCAIGDNLNDQDMVSWAGFGVAMGNAPEALKAIARYVTGPIGEAGVARVIQRFVIAKEEPTLRA